MTENDIKQMLSNAENVEVEYKSAKGGFPGSFWETFSAFANTDGGIIVLGVKEKDGVFTPDGLTDELIAKYKKVFWDSAHNKEKVSAAMLTEHDVQRIVVDGQQMLAFHIPRAPYMLRPVYLTPQPFGNTYKRNHEGDYHCTDDEVRLMFADAQSLSQSFDNKILPNYTIDDIDAATLRSYRQRFLLKREHHPWNDVDDMTFLTKIGAYRIDREVGQEGFTRAGIMMLGKTDSITDEVCAPWYFPDYQEKLSSDSRLRWTDRIYSDGTWEANLFQFFYRVYGKLAQSLPTPFMLNGITRVEETSAHVALREALVNCLVHCLYAQQGNILITRTPHRIMMRNPGSMLVSVDDFYAGSHSICRNPKLQKMFMFLGYGEKAGSGADIIVKGWEDNSWGRPVISQRVQPDETTMELDVEAIVNASKEEIAKKGNDVGENVGENVGEETDGSPIAKLTERQKKIYKLIKENPSISAKGMSEILSVASRTIERDLSEMQNAQVIVREGSDKGGRWEIRSKKLME